MLRHYLITAWRNLAANKLQSAIAVCGLTIGLAAAILAGIVGVNQFSFDHFIPGHERLYYAIMETHQGAGDTYGIQTPADLAAMLRNNFPQIEAATRFSRKKVVMRQGVVMAMEQLYWADPNFFQLMKLPVLYGDLATALARPDGLVIPLQTARKYFGRDNVVGQTLELDHQHMMTVKAVIADLPANASTLTTGIFASSLASFSSLAKDASRPSFSPTGGMFTDGNTILRLRSGVELDTLNRGASAMVDKFVPRSAPFRRAVHFERLDQLNLSPQVNPDARPRLMIQAAAALAILVLAGMNFVNLSTARSVQRGGEVAIRKVSGAGRRALIVQFLGELMLQVLIALCLAMMLVEWSLPAVNAFLQSGAIFGYWRDPALLAFLLAGAVCIGVAAGAYPALILSAFRPALALKGLLGGSAMGDLVRQTLVGLQFAILILLLIAAIVVFRQNRYVTTEALKINTDQTLLINMPACDEALRSRIATLPGVRATSCSSLSVLPQRRLELVPGVPRHRGAPELVNGYAGMSMTPVDYGFFESYGVKPVAGRLFRSGSNDQVPPDPTADQTAHYVINETAVRLLGYATPQEAVGQTLNFVNATQANHAPPAKPGEPPPVTVLNGTIIGVVPDFFLTPSDQSLFGNHLSWGTTYSVGLAETNSQPGPALLHVRLTGRNIPETLAAIDAAWKQSGALDPIDRMFLDTYIQSLEISVLREGQAFAVFAVIAMLLACLGLIGVSLSTTARRIKEIGVRKAMGATTGEIVMLLLWQFSKPVLWANLIAWPLAWWLMTRWLAGFPQHVTLQGWWFSAAGSLTLAVALATVAGQATAAARQKPVLALRYE